MLRHKLIQNVLAAAADDHFISTVKKSRGQCFSDPASSAVIKIVFPEMFISIPILSSRNANLSYDCQRPHRNLWLWASSPIGIMSILSRQLRYSTLSINRR
jgi:hypothetical protein